MDSEIQIENTTNNLPIIPDSKTKNIRINRVTILFIVLISFIIGILFGIVSVTHNIFIKNNSLQTKIPSIMKISPAPMLPISPTSSSLLPQKDTFYSGVYVGEYKNLQGKKAIYEKNGGMLSFLDGSGGLRGVDIENLKDQKLLFSSSIFNVDTMFFMYDGSQMLYAQQGWAIYQINPDINNISRIWEFKVDAKKYPGAGGSIINNVIDDKYLIVDLVPCWGCESEPFANVLVNISTGNDKFFKPRIGNVHINTQNNVFTYQKLSPFQESCEPGVGCNNGLSTVYKPSGQTFTEQLP